MKCKTISMLCLSVSLVIFLFSCKDVKIVTDVNSQTELELIVSNKQEDSENDISDVFDNDAKEEFVEEKSEYPTKQSKTEKQSISDNSTYVADTNANEVQQADSYNETEQVKQYNDVYVVIHGSLQYHTQDCEKLLDIGFDKKSFYTSEKELYFDNFTPCQICKP